MPIVFPDRDEMLERLKHVYDQGGQEHEFYNLLLADAGREFEPEGVVLGLFLALQTHKRNTSDPQETIGALLPRFIDALIDDPEARAAAHAAMKEAFPALYRQGGR